MTNSHILLDPIFNTYLYGNYYNKYNLDMPKSENQLNKAIAILQLLLAYTDDEHVLKNADIQNMLLDAFGIEGAQRSIIRDINQLMDLYNLREKDILDDNAKDLKFKYYLEYDPRNDKKGYHIIERPLDYIDAEFLIECINTSKSISNKTAEELKNKIASQRSIYEKEKLLNKNDIYTVGRTRTDNNKLLTVLDTIDYAIKNNHKISFKYKSYSFVNGKIQKIDRRKGSEYKISPYKTLMYDSNYYVLAVADGSDKVIPYRLDRMEDIQEVEEVREGMELFVQLDLKNYTKEVFNMFAGKREYVSIRFTNDLLTAIIDRFGDKEIKPYDDNHFVINTHVMVSDQFFSWLCGFKKKAKLLSPQYLIDDFQHFIDDISSINSYKVDKR